MSRAKCLAIFFALTTSPTARPISAAARSVRAFAADLSLDARKFPFGRDQKRLALAGALSGKIAIAAHDQPFARKVRRADLRQIPLVEQRELQRPMVLRQGLDLRRAQAGDPVQAGRFEILADPGRGDHAAVADQHHALDTEARLQLLDLRFQRRRIRRVALEHFDRDRQAVARAQQAVDDLQAVTAMIAAVAIVRQRTMAAFEVG